MKSKHGKNSGFACVMTGRSSVRNLNKAQAKNGYTALRGLSENQWDALELLHSALRLVRKRMGWDIATRRWSLTDDKAWQKFSVVVARLPTPPVDFLAPFRTPVLASATGLSFAASKRERSLPFVAV